MTEVSGIPNLMPFATGSNSPGRSSTVVAVSFSDGAEFLALTNSVAAGDEVAATEFFNAYCDRLFRYLLVVTRGDEELARDLLSVTMVKAVRKMCPMRSDGDIWRWLTRIAWTGFIDHCRKAKRRITTTTEENAAAVAKSGSEMELALAECMAELPVEEREIVERYYLDEKSQEELAAELSVTRKTIETRLARIRKSLRASLLKKLE